MVIGSGGSVIQGFSVTGVEVEDGAIVGVVGKFGKRGEDLPVMRFGAPLTIGAGGYRCPVATTLVEEINEEPMRDDDHYCGAYREYWENVGGFEGSSGPIGFTLSMRLSRVISGFSQSRKEL